MSRLHPNVSADQPPRQHHEVEINPEWAGQISGLAEALRWSSVARRERTPEVALLATWFAFEFLAGDTGRTPVEGIMELFPKVLAIGNLRRRLHYWWKSVAGSPSFDSHKRSDTMKRAMTQNNGATNYAAVMHLLIELANGGTDEDCRAIIDIIGASVLLRERTHVEGKLFSNSQFIAQTLIEDTKEIQRELQRFLLIRNKLVHRARIDHPLLMVVSERAKSRLYDLLQDLMNQLTQQRLQGTVTEVLHDYRDTFDELVADLGSGNVAPVDFINRVLLS